MGNKRSKRQKLELAVARIQRRFGPRSLLKGRLPAAPDVGRQTGVPHISTGFPSLDQALGIGGFPRGRVVELQGTATSGKTTLALKFLAQAQSLDGAASRARRGAASRASRGVAYVDQARYFDPDYAHRCGLDLSRLLIGRPYDLTEALAMTESLVRDGGVAALVLDLLDLFWTEPRSAQQLAASIRRLSTPLARSGSVLLFLHGVSSEGSAALSTLAHAAGVRLQLSRERWLRRHGDIRGYEARVEVVKNRQGPAGRAVKLRIEFNGTVRGNGL